MAARINLINRALLSVSLALLAFAIWATVDRRKFYPIYTPLLCTNPSAAIPVDLGKAMAEGVSNTLVVQMECTNPNPFFVSMKSSSQGSTGKVLSPNLTSPASPPVPVGEVTYEGMALGPDSQGINQVSFSVTLTPKLIQSSLGYMSAHKQTVPMYSVMDAKVDAVARFMHVTRHLQNVMPRKYCGYYLRLVTEGTSTSLTISSPMVCKNSLQGMEAALVRLNVTGGTAGHVDNLDPTRETLDGLARQIGVSSVCVMAVGYGLGGVLLVAALTLHWLLPRASKRETAAVNEGQAEEASCGTAV